MLIDDVLNSLLIIPKGKVVTYKDIACFIGKPRAYRAVGNALHKNKNFEIYPCYKVVNSKGELSNNYAFAGKDKQKELLEKEGIKVEDYRVNLTIYRFNYERNKNN